MGKPQLKVGDVVELNSGGPDMMIEKINAERAECSWSVQRDGETRTETHAFVLPALTLKRSA